MTRSRQWTLLTAVACLAVLAAGWFIVVKPQRSHAASYRSQAADVDQTSQTLQAQIAHLQAQAKDLPQQQQKLDKILQQVPNTPALPALIRQLSAAADGANVSLVSIAPGQPVLVQSTPASATSAGVPGRAVTAGSSTGSAARAATAGTTPASTTPAGPPLATIPLTIQVQGPYFNVESFFSALEGMQRAILVNQFSAAPLGNTGSTPGSTLPPDSLNVSISAAVFMSPSTAGLPVTATTTTTGK
jgi:Tfp pilus assembly protein PilO